jgi:hypothetical protein
MAVIFAFSPLLYGLDDANLGPDEPCAEHQ